MKKLNLNNNESIKTFKLLHSITESKIQIFAIALIILGSIIRLFHFIENRSLWLDEAVLSNNIVSRNLSALMEPLDFNQIAPIGFLSIQKLFLSVIGVHDYSLRIFPLIAGITSILIFYLMLRKTEGLKIAFISLLFFIFGKYLIYHSTEAKQYYLDVLVYLIAFYFLYFKKSNYQSYLSALYGGLIGAALIWFSHVAVIVLTTIGLALIIELLRKKETNYLIRCMIMCSIWLVSFGVNYFLFLFDHPSQTNQESAFLNAGYFPPSDGTESLIWLIQSLKLSLFYPISKHLTPPIIFYTLFMLGVLQIILKKNYKLFILIVPLAIHLILTYLKFYPFGERFILYSSPFFILCFVYGLKFLHTRIKRIGPLIALLFLAGSLAYPIKYSFVPIYFEEIKPALKFVQDERKSEDPVYVYSMAKHAFNFYENKYGFQNSETIKGSTYREGFDRDFAMLENYNAFWILLSHCKHSEKEYIRAKCNTLGKEIKQFEYAGASAFLYSKNAE